MMERNFIYNMLDKTAWRMEAPPLFGGFHIAALLIAVVLASAAAVLFARGIRRADDPERKLVRILAVTGWILALLEAYKQLFLYNIVNCGAYDWWFFPFQLCSVPMYLCILLPFLEKGIRKTFMTFMSGYAFVSAAAALIYPEDMLRTYVSLTVHGFLWHGIILFISLLIFFTGEADASFGGLLKAAGLFAFLCFVAVLLNMATVPLMEAYPEGHAWTAMFYLDPYHYSLQPLVAGVQKNAGIPAGLVLYALVIAAVSSIVTFVFSRLTALAGQRAR